MTEMLSPVLTSPGTESDWARTRHAATITELLRLNLAMPRGAVSADAAAWRRRVGLVVTSLFAWETGYGDGSPGTSGQGEHNFNPGSVHCLPTTPTCVLVGVERLKAYPSIAAGIADFLSTVEHFYPRAWPLLVSGELLFWDQLQVDGYGPGASATQAVSVATRVARLVGDPALTAEELGVISAGWHVPADDPGESGESGESGGPSAVPWLLLAVGLGWAAYRGK